MLPCCPPLLQLVWESHNQEPSAIGATLRAVGETVRRLLLVLHNSNNA